MKPFRLDSALPVDTTIPDPSLVIVIGAAGSGKSTWARTWPTTQVLGSVVKCHVHIRSDARVTAAS